MQAVRDALKGLDHPEVHPGLWLEKMLPDQQDQNGDGGENGKATHIRALEGRDAPAGYDRAFARWKSAFDSDTTLMASATVVGRMIVGLGAKGSLEAGLHLDHTWGVPIIPGSALKGVAAATAHHLTDDPAWKKPSDGKEREPPTAFDLLFGTTKTQGLVRFHDAWWVPENKLPIHLDVMTVHHPRYYQHAGSNPPPPSDTDSPTPVPFASVSGEYLVVVEAADPDWRDTAMKLLALGLEHLGVGAKTNAGYGRLSLAFESAAEQAEEAVRQAAARRESLLMRVGHVGRDNAADQVPRLLAEPDDVARRELAEAIVEALGSRWLEPKRASSAWAADLLDAAGVARTSRREAAAHAFTPEMQAEIDAAAGNDALRRLSDRALADDWPPAALKALETKLKKAMKNAKGSNKEFLSRFREAVRQRRDG